MPHIAPSILLPESRFLTRRLLLQFINLGLDVKKLYALKRAVNQARNTIEESQAEHEFVKKVSERRTRKSEKLSPEPATALRLCSGQRGSQLLKIPVTVEPDFRFPIRVQVVLANVVRKRCEVVMEQRIPELRRWSFHDYMFMNLHVCHGVVLVLQSTLIMALASAKQRKFVKTGTAMAQFAAEKVDAQGNIVSVMARIPNRECYLLRELWGKGLIRVEQENPIVRQGQRFHRPLPLFGPAASIAKLHHLSAERSCYFDCCVGALRIYDEHLSHLAQGFETAWQIARLVPHRDDH